MSERKAGARFIYVCVVIVSVSIFTIIAGCNGNGVNGPLPELSFDNLAVDFGMVEAEAGTTNQSITVTNSGDESVTVTDAVLSDTTNYTLTTDTLPLTLEPGDTTTVGCDFHPQASGTIDAAVTVSAEELDEDAVISLTGEGNYAPVVGSGYYVDYTTDSNFEGFYAEDGEKNGKPKYTKQHGTAGYLFYYDSSASASVQSRVFAGPSDPTWVIADSLDISDVASEAKDYTYNDPAPDDPSAGSWSNDTSIASKNGPFIDYSRSVDNAFEVYYGYSDAEGDTESGTAFQWYRSASEADEGDPIDGATGKIYEITGDDYGNYLKCQVTPKAESGIEDGAGKFSNALEPVG